MRTTLIAGMALALVASVPPVKADPPLPDAIVGYDSPAALICDTKDQIADIATAAIEGGVEAAIAVFRPYYETINDRGERVCEIPPIRGQFAFGKSVFIGVGVVNGRKRKYWAVNILVPSGKKYWVLWDEPLVRPGGLMVNIAGRWPSKHGSQQMLGISRVGYQVLVNVS